MRALRVLVLAVLLSGCVSSTAAPPSASSHSSDADAARLFHATAMSACPGDPPRDECAESSIAIDGNGRMYVADAWGTDLATSLDGGHTWAALPGPALPVHSAPTARDTDALVRATPDGRVVFSALLADYGAVASGVLLGLHIAVSSDGGHTWPANTLVTVDGSHNALASDRQWTAAGPDGALYVAFDDLYAPVLQPLGCTTCDATGNPLKVARSDDGGKTWGPFVEATPPMSGSSGGDITTTPSGELVMAAVLGPPDLSTTSLDLLRSKDRGATWSVDPVVGPLPAATGPSGWPSFAVADDGTEAVAWSQNGSLLLATRPPGGAWSAGTAWSAPGEKLVVDGALVSERDGWALSYVKFENGSATPSQADFLLVLGTSAGPTERLSLAEHVPLTQRSANSDFATLAKGPDGTLAVSVTRTGPWLGPPPATLAQGGTVEADVLPP